MDADEMKRRSRGISDDMSPAAIARRIDIVGELWRMWQTLRSARRIGPVVSQDDLNLQDIGKLPDSGRGPEVER
jgi:hypothetical protein